MRLPGQGLSGAKCQVGFFGGGRGGGKGREGKGGGCLGARGSHYSPASALSTTVLGATVQPSSVRCPAARPRVRARTRSLLALVQVVVLRSVIMIMTTGTLSRAADCPSDAP